MTAGPRTGPLTTGAGRRATHATGRTLPVCLALAVVCACASFALHAASATAAPSVKLAASFSPERLGAGTTIKLGFHVAYSGGEAPLPATGIQFLLPRELGVTTSELGLQNCLPARLEALGRGACPPDSLMGHGSTTTAVPFGSSFVVEHTGLLLFSGPVVASDPQLLFVAFGEYPVIAEVVFSALVLPAGPRFGGLIEAKLPLVPSVPFGPDVALLALQTTIGPAGITYREDVGGRIVSFRPKGILLPKSCPRGGFPFALQVSFSDGAIASTSTAVPCPRRHTSRPGAHPHG